MSSGEVRIAIRGEPDVTRAILESGRACTAIGCRDDQKSRVTTAVSELARNILKYADSGEIVVRARETRHARGVQVTAVDRGPGIEDVERALADHYSSGGTLGLGLPGVRRLMDEFDVQSTCGEGTRVTATLWL